MAISQKLRYQVMQRDFFTCQYCGENRKTIPGLKIEIDHIKPRSCGGTDTLDNLVTSCFNCNRGKRASHPTLHPLKTEQKKINRSQIEKVGDCEIIEIDDEKYIKVNDGTMLTIEKVIEIKHALFQMQPEQEKYLQLHKEMKKNGDLKDRKLLDIKDFDDFCTRNNLTVTEGNRILMIEAHEIGLIKNGGHPFV